MPKRAKKPKISVLVTAGPTRAYLDDVRFLSNYSSGALGFAICAKLVKAGHSVRAIVGPTSQPFDQLKMEKLIAVETAKQMHDAVLQECRRRVPKVAVFAAAVLDFEPRRLERGKVSSARKTWTLRLVPTPKIIDEVGAEFPQVIRIGFKLEPRSLSAVARDRLAERYRKRKQLDYLCLNFRDEVSADRHRAYLFGPERRWITTSKSDTARKLLEIIEGLADSAD